MLIFLAAVLVLGACCAHKGVLVAVGSWLARLHSGGGRLLFWVFAVAAVVTSVLSLDVTVVLLTPVMLSAAGRLGVSPRPYVYATGHVANSGSLLLPTGNLTNLLALGAAGVTLVHFAALMLLPWMCVLALEYVVLRVFLRDDLVRPATPTEPADDQVSGGGPSQRFASVVLGMTLAVATLEVLTAADQSELGRLIEAAYATSD